MLKPEKTFTLTKTHINLITQLNIKQNQDHIYNIPVLPMIDEICKITDYRLEDIDAIAVSAGPGSFTGLRIGSATAKGLGLALGKPIIPVPTVDGLAYQMYGTDKLICPIMDARRNQVYTGIYRNETEFLVIKKSCAIAMEELLEEPCARAMGRLHINAGGKMISAVRMLRTFFLVCIGDLFFRAESVSAAFAMLRGAVTTWNPGIFWNGSLFTLGLDAVECGIAAASLLLLLVVSILQQKGSVRDRIAGRKLPVRWLIWYALLFYVILFGCYGPEYSAAEFIYQGF